MRKTLVAVMLVVAVLAVAIPTCIMVGCDMSMPGGMMMGFPHTGTSFTHPCDGSWVDSARLVGVAPGEFLSLIIVLIAAMYAAVLMFSPRAQFQPVRIVEAHAPPPPLEPRGERFLL
jgi:hypothetical protein